MQEITIGPETIETHHETKEQIEASSVTVPYDASTGRFDSSKENQGNTPRELTQREWGKIRRMYMTVQHGRVQICGHRFHPLDQPRTNCQYCWFAFFNAHGELTKAVDGFVQEYGQTALTNMRGVKFVKNFLRFMATMVEMTKAAEVIKENNESSTTGVGGDNNTNPNTSSGSAPNPSDVQDGSGEVESN